VSNSAWRQVRTAAAADNQFSAPVDADSLGRVTAKQGHLVWPPTSPLLSTQDRPRPTQEEAGQV